MTFEAVLAYHQSGPLCIFERSVVTFAPRDICVGSGGLVTLVAESKGKAHHGTPRTPSTSRISAILGLPATKVKESQEILTSPAPTPSWGSADLLNRLVHMSKRGTGIQLPVGFVRAEGDTARPPVARMLRDGHSSRGGRGGAVRLKLYLCLNLLAAKPPHDVRRRIPARAWAEALDLPDPSKLGARRVGDALAWLDRAKMITVKRERGDAPVITLLDPTGNGSKYKRYSPYVQVPNGFWREQWIVRLSGSAVALLIVLLDLQGGKKSRQDAPWLPTRQRARYGLSDDTWTRASKELVEHGLLTIDRIPQGRDFDFRRMRNTYWIDKSQLTEPDPDYPNNSLNFPPPPPRRRR